VDALTLRYLQNPKNPISLHPSWYRVGGLDLSSHTVLPSRISVAASVSPRGSDVGPAEVHGLLAPARPGAIVTVDYFNQDVTASQLLKVGTNGSFSGSIALHFVPSGVRAVWQGDLLYESAVATGPVITRATTSTSLTSSVNPSQFGQSVTFTATVKAAISGTPSGSVTFKDGATVPAR
jgi:hypothetical protein